MYDAKPGDIVRIKWGDDWLEFGLVVDRKEERAKHIVNRAGFIETLKIMLNDGTTDSFPCTYYWDERMRVVHENE